MGQTPGLSVSRPIRKPEGAGAKIRGSTRAGGGEAPGQGANPAQDGGGSGSGGAQEAVRSPDPGGAPGTPPDSHIPYLSFLYVLLRLRHPQPREDSLSLWRRPQVPPASSPRRGALVSGALRSGPVALEGRSLAFFLALSALSRRPPLAAFGG